MSELKRCPICDKEVEITKDNLMDFHVIECNICKILMYSRNKEELINKWNTRKPMDRIVERLEHLLKNFGEHCENQGEECTHKSCSDCVLSHGIEIVKEEGGMNE